jgi:hypothetical protein
MMCHMTALTSALASVASVLGIWCAVSLVSFPVLVLCVRLQERANARLTSQVRRQDWAAATRS